jgi:hypothetical protein
MLGKFPVLGRFYHLLFEFLVSRLILPSYGSVR